MLPIYSKLLAEAIIPPALVMWPQRAAAGAALAARGAPLAPDLNVEWGATHTRRLLGFYYSAWEPPRVLLEASYMASAYLDARRL